MPLYSTSYRQPERPRVPRLFDDETIFDGFYPFNASGDMAGLVDGILRIYEAAQLNNTFSGFNTILK